MNNKQLHTFVTVVDEGGFSQAARKLFITQPAVSWQIKSMEKEVETLLIERNDRDVLLTKAGEILYRNAKIILEQHNVLSEELEHLKSYEHANIRVAASTIPGEYILPEEIKCFKREHNHINIKLYISDSKEVIEKVICGAVSFGITGAKPEHPELKAEFYREDRLKLICAMDYPVHKFKDLHAVVKEPIVMREEGSGTRTVILNYLKNQGCQLTQIQHSSVFGSTKSSLSAVETGLGVGWVSEAAISDALKLGRVKIISDVFDIKRELYIISHKNRTLSPSAKLLKDCLIYQSIDPL